MLFEIEPSRYKSIHELFLETCSITLRTYIKSYLSALQPYCLCRFSSDEIQEEGELWLSDPGYGVAMKIKIRNDHENQPMVVSFCENNKMNGLGTERKYFKDTQCAVLVDSRNETMPSTFFVDYTIQLRFIKYGYRSRASHYDNGVALVEYENSRVKNFHRCT